MPEQADLRFMAAGTCPSCGGDTVRDPHALVNVTFVSVYPLRSEHPYQKLVPCDIEYCTACGWTFEHSRGGCQ